MKPIKFKSIITFYASVFFMCFIMVNTQAQHGSAELHTSTHDPSPKTIYGNSTPLAYASITSNGSIQTEYGVTSVDHSQAGIYVITLDNGFVGDPIVNATIRSFGSMSTAHVIAYQAEPLAATITIFIHQFSGGSNFVDDDFSVVVYGTPLNYFSGCPSDTSGTGIAQAPNDILRFNAVEDANCVIDIPFAFTDPALVKVDVMGFVGGGTSTVEVEITFDPPGAATTQTVNLTSAGLVLNLGQYNGFNGTPYTTWLDLTYDGVQFVTARVRMDAL